MISELLYNNNNNNNATTGVTISSSTSRTPNDGSLMPINEQRRRRRAKVLVDEREINRSNNTRRDTPLVSVAPGIYAGRDYDEFRALSARRRNEIKPETDRP